jgi:hypothetical protein
MAGEPATVWKESPWQIYLLTRPHSLIVDTTDVQAGSELSEDCRWKPFGEDVCILGGCRHMEGTDITESHSIPVKVQINLNMLGSLMLDEV